MGNWFVLSIITLILWGFCGLFQKIATNYIEPKSILIFGALGSICVGLIVLFLIGFKLQMHPKGIIFAVLGGLTGTLGVLFFIIALDKGKVSVIVPLTALYPIITITLGFLILKESITLTQGVGVIFALIAVLLLAI